MNLKPRKVVFVRSESDARAYYRMFAPCKALAAKGWVALIDDVEEDDFTDADILVFQRQSNPWAIREIIGWKVGGKKIVFDFADNIFERDAGDSTSREIAEKNRRMKAVIALADAVTVSTKSLVKVFSKINKNVHVLSSCLSEAAFERSRKTTKAPIIGWRGSAREQNDLKMVKDTIDKLVDEQDASFVTRSDGDFAEDLSFFERFHDFSIGICPAADSTLGADVSDLRFLEYAALGIPTVASKERPYLTIKHGKTGFLARNINEWQEYLLRLVGDVGLRQEIGDAARKYALKERTIETNIWRWEAVYKSL